mgnify:CR=1 FL=1
MISEEALVHSTELYKLVNRMATETLSDMARSSAPCLTFCNEPMGLNALIGNITTDVNISIAFKSSAKKTDTQCCCVGI